MTIVVQGNRVIMDGEMLPLAPSKGKNISIVGNNVFIDGYEFKRGKWRRSLRALWHLIAD